MAKAGRGADQYMLRLPDGLRDRIKAYAERRGTSINSEIVRVLERQWPEQWPINDRLSQLAEAVNVLAAGKSDPRIAQFINDFEKTVEGIISGRVTGVDIETRESVVGLWEEYQRKRGEDEAETYQSEYDEEEDRTMSLIGRPEKYAIPPAERKRLGNLSDEELEIYKLGYEAGLDRRHEPISDSNPFGNPLDKD
ncbi:hypothetical protein CU102_12360 [Phyllobacterium brassicacearum]|uniref:Arc-like DNA binding domain-containing protein n=1 Tax=Phyllobacterium brassicacearum TaxID=314235 RepID=A0A2P7BQ16_9HYPH|nr:Arc family DNA-binding protein [Phyllobacterium brassicacearum]PSH68550.1 hypothetical protein CU102_12360 [Phyllobacterium brassicacearum]TDQ19899.1 Arc-like DNA binding dprotein [Phyllobacterium brassicacearum]